MHPDTVTDDELKRHLLTQYREMRDRELMSGRRSEGYRWVMHPSWLMRIYQMQGLFSSFAMIPLDDSKPETITGIPVSTSWEAGEPELVRWHPDLRFEFTEVRP